MLTQLAPSLRCLRAPNPSPLTGTGTNTYLIGTEAVVVIDPGPDIEAHLDAILTAIGDATCAAILVTHSHLDHTALVPRLAAATGAPTYGFGDVNAGRSAVMQALIESPEGSALGGAEGRDAAFVPDHTLGDGEVLHWDGDPITALWTPGHFNNHLCFAWRDVLFTGDLVMGWSTSLVSPPDGDLTQFMASCAQLADRSDRAYYPGHGDPVTAPATRVRDLIAHRQVREAQILEALDTAPGTPGDITARVYTDVAPHLWPAAERNVLAHLIDLHSRGLVTCAPGLSRSAIFTLSTAP
ncbi:MAG: MBL fold metallo-hydrolase [Pseudomonadota bacterium]